MLPLLYTEFLQVLVSMCGVSVLAHGSAASTLWRHSWREPSLVSHLCLWPLLLCLLFWLFLLSPPLFHGTHPVLS